MAAARTDHALERLVFFSDAVFAIAITLLVIEIHPPHLEHGASAAAQWAALALLWPSFFGYLVSFMVIGLFWMGHHRAFALASTYSPRVLWWNLMLLAVIAFMPFFTAFYSANIAARVPVIVYCGAMLAAALLNYKVNRTATGPPMVGHEVAPERIAEVRGRSLGVVFGAATAFAASLIIPYGATAGLATIPLWQRLMIRLTRPRPGGA